MLINIISVFFIFWLGIVFGSNFAQNNQSKKESKNQFEKNQTDPDKMHNSRENFWSTFWADFHYYKWKNLYDEGFFDDLFVESESDDFFDNYDSFSESDEALNSNDSGPVNNPESEDKPEDKPGDKSNGSENHSNGSGKKINRIVYNFLNFI